MEIDVLRDLLTDNTTTGKMLVNDHFHCYTLEDKTRDKKVYGETCIPCGRYKVTMHYWEKHKAWYPMLNNVPGYAGILIHKGISKKDTLGCVLVGMDKGKDSISNCAQAFDPLKQDIVDALKTEEVWINVKLAEDLKDERTSTT
jgi:hypothetical protein